MMVRVILLAGGIGTRMQSLVPKQHIEINSHQLIEYTIMAFSNCEDVNAIDVVSNKDYVYEVEKLKNKYPKLKNIIIGGSTRIQSVYKAIVFLKNENNDDKIIISDAARPCITKKEITKMIRMLDTFSAVTTWVNNNETLLMVENSKINRIIQRDGIVRQTSPEGYRLFVLKKLYLEAERKKISSYKNIGIDELFSMGYEIGLVKSNNLNFKITTKDDLELFELVLKRGFDTIING